ATQLSMKLKGWGSKDGCEICRRGRLRSSPKGAKMYSRCSWRGRTRGRVPRELARCTRNGHSFPGSLPSFASDKMGPLSHFRHIRYTLVPHAWSVCSVSPNRSIFQTGSSKEIGLRWLYHLRPPGRPPTRTVKLDPFAHRNLI